MSPHRPLVTVLSLVLLLASCGGEETPDATAEPLEPGAGSAYGVDVCLALLPALEGETDGLELYATANVIADLQESGLPVPGEQDVYETEAGCGFTVPDASVELELDRSPAGDQAVVFTPFYGEFVEGGPLYAGEVCERLLEAFDGAGPVAGLEQYATLEVLDTLATYSSEGVTVFDGEGVCGYQLEDGGLELLLEGSELGDYATEAFAYAYGDEDGADAGGTLATGDTLDDAIASYLANDPGACQGDTEDVRGHDVVEAGGITIAVITCNFGANQGMVELVRWDDESGQLQYLDVPQYDDGDVTASPFLVGFVFAEGDAVIAEAKDRGVGGCGTRHEWVVATPNELALQRVRQQSCEEFDSGQGAEDPADYPVVYEP